MSEIQPQSMSVLGQNITNFIPITINIYYAKTKLLIYPDSQNFSPAIMLIFLWARESPIFIFLFLNTTNFRYSPYIWSEYCLPTEHVNVQVFK